MQFILSSAIIVTLLSCLLVLLKFGKTQLNGPMPVKLFAFIAILFTSGLDVGLIMLPLTEFPIYAGDTLKAGEPNPYDFANALVVSFGFWGGIIWAFYFLTTFYFCAIEPKVNFFEIPLIKFVNNIVIIATCAFTGFIFLSNLPTYSQNISPFLQYAIVGFVVLCAVFSSTHIRYVRLLSETSTWLFLGLIILMWVLSGAGLTGLGQSLTKLSDYFAHIPRFAIPVSDYHAFYLFWWFSWSIMIGQFVARFVNKMAVWKLFIAMLIFPSIPIALWFSVLYLYYIGNITIAPFLNISMVIVGITFVINSLDSLTRLYTTNIGLTIEKIGMPAYIGLNWGGIYGLILLYQFTPLKIEWIGLTVIGLYVIVYGLLIRDRKKVSL